MHTDRTLLIVVSAIGAGLIGIVAVLAPQYAVAITIAIAAFTLLLMLLGQ
ncbi:MULTISPECIES: hypothetical protein [unclassified Streptomyces]